MLIQKLTLERDNARLALHLIQNYLSTVRVPIEGGTDVDRVCAVIAGIELEERAYRDRPEEFRPGVMEHLVYYSTVTAQVRQRGSIGIFEQQKFKIPVLLKHIEDRSKIVDAFLANYGGQWELNYIIHWTKLPES